MRNKFASILVNTAVISILSKSESLKKKLKKSAAVLPQTNDTLNAGLVAGGVLSMLGSALLFFRKK